MGFLVDKNNNSKKENNFNVKIIFMAILSLCWKSQLSGYFRTSQVTSRKMTGSAHGKHILTSDGPSSQHNKTLAPWRKHSSRFPGKSALGCWGRGVVSRGKAVPWAGTAGTDTTESAGDKQSSINAPAAVLPRKIKITRGVTGEKSPAKTYVLPKHLKPKSWLIQSCFEQSHKQRITLLWV